MGKEVVEYSKHNIWVGLFDILIKNKTFKTFTNSKRIGIYQNQIHRFCVRPEGRKNPHFLDNIKSFHVYRIT